MHHRWLTVRKEINNRKDKDHAGPQSRGEAVGCKSSLVRHCLLNLLWLITDWTGRAVGASSRVGIMRSYAINTPDSRVTAWATANTTSGCGAGVLPCKSNSWEELVYLYPAWVSVAYTSTPIVTKYLLLFSPIIVLCLASVNTARPWEILSLYSWNIIRVFDNHLCFRVMRSAHIGKWLSIPR